MNSDKINELWNQCSKTADADKNIHTDYMTKETFHNIMVSQFQSQQKQSAVIDNALVDKLQPDFKECRNHYDYADAVELLRNFAAQAPTKQSAVWVKASEREPENNGNYYVKCTIDGFERKLIVELTDDCWMPPNSYDTYETYSIIEWLDETQRKQPSDEEIQELAEKEYPLDPLNAWHDNFQKDKRYGFIKGYKAAQTPLHENL